MAASAASPSDADDARGAASEAPPASGHHPGPDDTSPRAGSLFEDVPATEHDSAFGRLGPPVSRHSAFYRGFFGGLGVLVAIVVGLAIREATESLELILIAVFLAVGLNPIVEYGIRRGLRRGWVVLGVGVVIVGVVTTLAYVIGGVLRNQITTLINDAPKLLNDLLKHKSIAQFDRKYHIISSIEHKLQSPNFTTKYFGGVFNIGLSVLHAVIAVVIVFILTIYFLAALPVLKRTLYSLAPATRRERVGQLGDEILRRVGRYVIGAVVVALIAGTVSLIFMFTVGLGQYALPLAMIVALLDLVPLVGSILGASLVSIVGLANSLPIGIACVVFYLIYETLEGYVIYPRVMRSSVDVPEYVTIIAVLVGGAVAGVLGALLALPIAAALLLLVREVWVRRQDQS
ncbi:MAG TPA: AI-2E family transporter [Jatrophihabitantaceae bacterium]|jgi:predicted PurR-regulated permease PerM